MFDNLSVFRMSLGMAQHAGQRQAEISRNVANADTPGFRARDLQGFADTYREDFGGTAMRATRPGHLSGMTSGGSLAEQAFAAIDAPDDESPNGNTVSLEDQMVKGAEVRNQYDLALGIYQSSLGILRTSLGRR